MRAINFRRTTGYDDSKVNELCRDVERGFDAIVDLTVYKMSLVWNPPHNIQIPYFGGAPRLTSPDIVRCERAKNLTNPTWPTIPGGADWDWVGNNQVRVNEVSGLVNGQKYDLVFMVMG